jgi:hypothetical protein
MHFKFLQFVEMLSLKLLQKIALPKKGNLEKFKEASNIIHTCTKTLYIIRLENEQIMEKYRIIINLL